MALTKDTTASIVTKFGTSERDTGNTRVQVALLTERIKQLTEHCKTFKKDKTAENTDYRRKKNTGSEGGSSKGKNLFFFS